MKISELEIKDYLAREPLAEDNSFIILNYAGNDTDEPVTYRVTLNELSNMIINNHKILRYTGTNKNLISTAYGNNAYANTESLGQFIDPADRTVLDATLTNVSYDTTNKKLVSTTRSNQEADDIVSVATILTDMNLNQSDTADSTKYVSAVSETDGVITVSRESFSPTITWTNAEEGVNNNKPTINISVAGNSATTQPPNEASTTVYGITKLSSAIDSNSEILAATPKAVKDAIESLDVDNLNSGDTGYDANKAHITGFAANKTLSSLTETDGKIAATFQDISITSSQISNSNTNEGDVVKLNSSRLIPSNLLPSYVDDVIEGYLYNNKFYQEVAHTNEVEGAQESGKIYVDLTEGNRTVYRWGGSAYAAIPIGLALGTTSTTAYNGQDGLTAYNHATDNLRLTEAKTTGLYKIATTAQGHVASVTAVQKDDITALGIPDSDTTYEMDGTYNASTNKVATVSTVTSAVSNLYTKPTSGIPATDLAETYIKLPTLPTTDGTYTLQVTISTGNDPVYTWETNLA